VVNERYCDLSPTVPQVEHAATVNSDKLDSMLTSEKRERRLLRASKDVGIFAIYYVLAFVIFRFDIRRHGTWFRHPMPNVTAAWVALVLAIAGFLYYKTTNKN
jgi:hypothetical protein